MNALTFAKFLKVKNRQPVRDQPMVIPFWSHSSGKSSTHVSTLLCCSQLAVLELKHARLTIKTLEALAQPEALKTLTHLDLTNALTGALGVQGRFRRLMSCHVPGSIRLP
jgi:hypothetical protein